jgi:hypothetical protein
MGKSLTGSRRRGKQLAKACVEFAIRASKARESVATSDRLLAISSVDGKTGCGRSLPVGGPTASSVSDRPRLCENTKSISQILILADFGQQTCSESNYMRVFYLVFRSKCGGHEFSHSLDPERSDDSPKSYRSRVTERTLTAPPVDLDRLSSRQLSAAKLGHLR